MFKFLSICLGNERLRRRILAFFPNAFTVMNAIMGLLAVFFAYQGRLRRWSRRAGGGERCGQQQSWMQAGWSTVARKTEGKTLH